MALQIDARLTETRKKRSAPRYWVEIKGRLYARMQYMAENGKYKVKYKPITDKRLARRAVEEMRRELELYGQEILNSAKMTFAELAEKYAETKLVDAVYQNGVKISGMRSTRYVHIILRTLITNFGSRPIRSIKPSDLERFKESRLRSVTKDGRIRRIASVNRELSIFRTVLNFAVQNEWIVKNPFSKLKGLIASSAEMQRDRVLSFEEEFRLLSACTGRRAHLKPILFCALDTGMRSGEMFKMKWEDVNFESLEIRIPKTNTKTEESRIVGLTPRLANELHLLWEISTKSQDHTVFGINDSVRHSWITACRLANIKDFRLHDCRHTATTRMIASGSPHTEVMKITGHSQIKTFLRYLNITTETTSRVTSRLHDYLANGRNVVASVSESIN